MADAGRNETAEFASLSGQLLIAMPAMADPRFAQTVIYMCAHTPGGAMGLVLNRPLARPSTAHSISQRRNPHSLAGATGAARGG